MKRRFTLTLTLMLTVSIMLITLGAHGAQPVGANGGEWHAEDVASDLGEYGGFQSIALDSQSVSHVSLCDFDANSGSLVYGIRESGGWNLKTVDDGGVGVFTRLALDTNDNPHIVFFPRLMVLP